MKLSPEQVAYLEGVRDGAHAALSEISRLACAHCGDEPISDEKAIVHGLEIRLGWFFSDAERPM